MSEIIKVSMCLIQVRSPPCDSVIVWVLHAEKLFVSNNVFLRPTDTPVPDAGVSA